jgi:3'-5' exoribonuclease
MAGPGMDKNVLLVAAYWHDYAKLNEYQCDISGGKIAVTEYRKTTGHVVGSSYALMYYLIRHKMDIPDLDPIVHCMLSHHGRREWGSPVEPATREAWTLHAADMLSSRGCE